MTRNRHDAQHGSQQSLETQSRKPGRAGYSADLLAGHTYWPVSAPGLLPVAKATPRLYDAARGLYASPAGGCGIRGHVAPDAQVGPWRSLEG